MFVKKAWSFWRQLQVLSCRPEAEVPAQVFSIFVLDCDPRCFCCDCSYQYPEGEISLYYIHLHSADTSSLIGGRGTSSCTTSPPCWSWSPPGPSSSSPPPPTHPGCQQWTMAIYCNHHWQSLWSQSSSTSLAIIMIVYRTALLVTVFLLLINIFSGIGFQNLNIKLPSKLAMIYD